MRGLHHLQRTLLIATIVAIAAAGLAMTATAATAPVTVTFAVNGTPSPGASVTDKATITINDGSSLVSVKWTQTGGLPAQLANTTTDTVAITLPDRKTFKDELATVLEEAPITNAQFPAYVPKPAKYESGLQNRFVVTAITPRSLEEAGAIAFDLAVTTTSGTYHSAVSVAAALPWTTATGNRNVPVNVPVLVHAKSQATYDWKLTGPAASKATLIDAATQNPEFTPDIPGAYQLTVTDLATNKPVTLNVAAGKWKGIVVGQDVNGRPTVDPACTSCHVKNTPNFDMFTPWAQSGHAEIFTQNVNTPNGHYGSSCLGCHTVGYNATNFSNNGVAEQPDFAAFVASGLMAHGDAVNWTKILNQFPLTARMANIQCENCHGPQDSVAHMQNDGSRQTLSSDLCGTCHGEPARHGRYQQWQISGHANFEVAVSEGTDPTCSKCHSAQGFLAWQDNNFSTASLTVKWTADDVQPQTCQTCHDPHAVGTTSGDANTNATVRIMKNTPKLMSGYVANDVGSAAICMTCHNGRRDLRDDQHFTVADSARAPHEGPQADIVMGQNLYFAAVGTRGYHGMLQDSCVTCHMEKTPPPSALSLPGVGTNHAFSASKDICTQCHTEITADKVQNQVQGKLTSLKGAIETGIKTSMLTQLRGGNTIDLNGQKTLKSASDLASVAFVSSHGSQGIDVTLSNGTVVAGLSMTTVKVVRPGGAAVALYAVTDPIIPKAGWNYFSVINDKSLGVHNPAFVNSALDASITGVTLLNTIANSPANAGNAAIGGGVGNGAGAVSCTTPFVYWAEIVGHAAGVNGSQWRTDLVARNLGSTTANLRFVLHQPGGNIEGTGTVLNAAQSAFEDIAGYLGATNNIGSLEICSDQPLLVAGRTFNQATGGTFGQNFEGYVADLGYGAGQTVSLIGMRQKSDAFRSNLSVTNGGTTEAQVAIVLYDSTGKALTNYNLTIPAGLVLQDNEPFRNRASAPDVDWGFATVTVLKGTNIRTSASLIDSKTNDPSTIPPKQ